MESPGCTLTFSNAKTLSSLPHLHTPASFYSSLAWRKSEFYYPADRLQNICHFSELLLQFIILRQALFSKASILPHSEQYTLLLPTTSMGLHMTSSSSHIIRDLLSSGSIFPKHRRLMSQLQAAKQQHLAYTLPSPRPLYSQTAHEMFRRRCQLSKERSENKICLDLIQ